MTATKLEIDARPWYRQFWLWVVLAPLITVVCVSAVMVSIAFYYADDVVVDNYYKQGRMINQSLEQDRRALALGLRAQLQFDRLIGEVVVTVNTPAAQETALPEKLLLSLDHRFEADLDQEIVVHQSSPGHYRGELLVKPEYRWYLALSPALDKNLRREAEWVLSGEINFAQTDGTELTPRVSAQ